MKIHNSINLIFLLIFILSFSYGSEGMTQDQPASSSNNSNNNKYSELSQKLEEESMRYLGLAKVTDPFKSVLLGVVKSPNKFGNISEILLKGHCEDCED